MVDLVEEFHKASKEEKMEVAVAVAETIAASDFIDCAEEAEREWVYTDIFVEYAKKNGRMPDDWVSLEDDFFLMDEHLMSRIYRLMAEGKIDEAARLMRELFGFLPNFNSLKKANEARKKDKPWRLKRNSNGSFVRDEAGKLVWENE